MNLALLILIAGFMPLLWGWIVFRLMSKVWPSYRVAEKPRVKSGSTPPLDYQI